MAAAATEAAMVEGARVLARAMVATVVETAGVAMAAVTAAVARVGARPASTCGRNETRAGHPQTTSRDVRSTCAPRDGLSRNDQAHASPPAHTARAPARSYIAVHHGYRTPQELRPAPCPDPTADCQPNGAARTNGASSGSPPCPPVDISGVIRTCSNRESNVVRRKSSKRHAFRPRLLNLNQLVRLPPMVQQWQPAMPYPSPAEHPPPPTGIGADFQAKGAAVGRRKVGGWAQSW